MPSRRVGLADSLAQATVASRSDITWASGTLETTLEISRDVLNLGDIALAGVEFGGDGQIAEFGQAAADILDVLVNTEDLLHDQDRGERARPLRHGPIGRDLAVGDGIFTSPAISPAVSVAIVWAEIGCVARAKPDASDVTTKPRRVRSLGDSMLLESSFIGRYLSAVGDEANLRHASLRGPIIIASTRWEYQGEIAWPALLPFSQ